LKIGIVHYSCAPLIGGVEEVITHHAALLHRMGQSVRVIAGMGEVYTRDFPVRIEPLLASRNTTITRAHEQTKSGDYSSLRRLVNRIYGTLAEWGDGLDVILAHNVLHMPFNLPLTLALRRMATTDGSPIVVSWAHDSPYFQSHYPDYLEDHPWNVLRRPHKNIHLVTISESRKQLFSKLWGGVKWRVINNGVDPASILYLDEKSVMLAQELDIFTRDLVLVQPSRITPRKNLELSIHIVRGIKLMGFNVLFVLTGAYDPHEQKAVSYYRRLRYWIKELGIEENVAILAEYRFKDRRKLNPDRVFIRDLYLMADLLLMTSRDEGFGLPLLEAGLVKLPIACSEIQPFRELGKDVCFFRLDEHPLSIAGRIVEYLSRSSTHQMFRNVMKKHVLEVICQREILPFLREIVIQK